MSRITTKYIFDYHDDSRADYNGKASTVFNKTFMTYDQFKTSNYVADKLKNGKTITIESDKYDNYPVWKILKYICQIHNPNETTTNSYSQESNMFGYFSNADAIRSPLFAINTLDSINKELYLKADSVMFISASAVNRPEIINKNEFKELKFIDSTLSANFMTCDNLMSCNYLFNYRFKRKDENDSVYINPQINLTDCSQLTEVGLNDEIVSLSNFNITNCPITYFEFPEKTTEMNQSVLRNCPNIYDVQINNNTKKLKIIVERCPNFTSSSIDISINPTVFANTIKNLRIVIPDSITEIRTLIGSNNVIEHLHIKNKSNNIRYGDDFIYSCPKLKTITGDYFKARQINYQRQYNFYNPINFENKYNCFESDSVLRMHYYNSSTFTFPNHMTRFYNMIQGFADSVKNTNIDYKVDIKFLEDSSFGANAYYGVPNRIFDLYEELMDLATNNGNITISLRLYNFGTKYYSDNDMYYDIVSTLASCLSESYPTNRRVSIHNDDFGSTILDTNL